MHLRHRTGRGGKWVELFEERVEGHDVYSSAPKGRFIPAQGNALGSGLNKWMEPCRGEPYRDIVRPRNHGTPFQGSGFCGGVGPRAMPQASVDRTVGAEEGTPLQGLGVVGDHVPGALPRAVIVCPFGAQIVRPKGASHGSEGHRPGDRTSPAHRFIPRPKGAIYDSPGQRPGFEGQRPEIGMKKDTGAPTGRPKSWINPRRIFHRMRSGAVRGTAGIRPERSFCGGVLFDWRCIPERLRRWIRKRRRRRIPIAMRRFEIPGLVP